MGIPKILPWEIPKIPGWIHVLGEKFLEFRVGFGAPNEKIQEFLGWVNVLSGKFPEFSQNSIIFFPKIQINEGQRGEIFWEFFGEL